MIEGEVNPFSEAVVPVRIRASDGRLFEVEATIDTGFSGYLTLPIADIETLGLVFDQEEEFMIGRGVTESFAIYRAKIIWDEAERIVPVLATDNGTLIGMKMLRGTRLTIIVVDGGKVVVEVIA